MKDIKFRVWDAELEVFIQSFCIDNSGDPFLFCEETGVAEVLNVELMQYTGLKDKNGVEIYEGDIVEIYGTGKCTVSITPQLGVCFTSIDDKFIVDCAHDVLMENDLGGIVGNIYENPELLKD